MGNRIGVDLKSTICVMIVLFSTFFIASQGSAIADQEGDYAYTISGTPSVVTITSYTGAGGAITIPSTLGGFPVTSIGNQAFYSRTSLISVSIPIGVTSIGESAFALCASMSSVSMPGGVITIGDWAFSSCTSLTSVSMPDSVTTIGDWAFESCTSLTSITIPDSVDTIGDWTFDYCSSLTSVTIGGGVSYIGANAFHRCSSLISMTFLGLAAPYYVDNGWIEGTPAGIRGHAYASSDFPSPGEIWNGLTMGAVIPLGQVPGLPQGLHATGNNAQVILNWQDPSSDGSSPITGYRLYRSTTSDGSYAIIASPTSPTYTDTALSVGLTYWYKVSALNAMGEGEQTPAVSALVPPANPSNDYSLLIVLGIIAIAIAIAALLFYRRRPKIQEYQRKSKRK